jgi:hypothetical protein
MTTTIRRRTFVQKTALAALAPAIGDLLCLLPAPSRAALPVAQVSGRGKEDDGRLADVSFGINGWDFRETVAMNGSGVSASDATSDGQVWIGVNQSWRATWR